MAQNISWGSPVVVSKTHTDPALRGMVGSVAGIYTVDQKDIANNRSCKIGDTFYLIEFGDGSSIELHEKYVFQK